MPSGAMSPMLAPTEIKQSVPITKGVPIAYHTSTLLCSALLGSSGGQGRISSDSTGNIPLSGPSPPAQVHTDLNELYPMPQQLTHRE